MNIAKFICFIAVSASFAQNADIKLDSILENNYLIIDSLSKNAEVLELKYPKAYWGNKYSLPIGDFAVAKIKGGLQITSSGPKNGVSESKTRSKFSIEIKKDKDVVLAKAEGRLEQLSRSEFSTYGGLLDIFTNIETETIGAEIDNMKTITAKIDVRDVPDELWVLEFKTSGRAADFKIMEGLVTNGTRMIHIAQNNIDVPRGLKESPFPEFDFRAYSSLRYDFTENGKTIGALKREGQNCMMFDPDIDPVSKLVLMAAMLSIEQ